jgi:AbrB family looped-hinge helix DNA binding protein
MPTIRIRKDGRITLPTEFRKRYNVQEGDKYEVTEIGDGLFCRLIRAPKSSAPSRKKSSKAKTAKS